MEKLVQAGLPERIEDPDGRHTRRISLSAQGKGLIERGIQERHRWVEAVAARLNPEDLIEMNGLLVSIRRFAATQLSHPAMMIQMENILCKQP